MVTWSEKRKVQKFPTSFDMSLFEYLITQQYSVFSAFPFMHGRVIGEPFSLWYFWTTIAAE